MGLFRLLRARQSHVLMTRSCFTTFVKVPEVASSYCRQELRYVPPCRSVTLRFHYSGYRFNADQCDAISLLLRNVPVAVNSLPQVSNAGKSKQDIFRGHTYVAGWLNLLNLTNRVSATASICTNMIDQPQAPRSSTASCLLGYVFRR